jgi:CBS domain-containing protein
VVQRGGRSPGNPELRAGAHVAPAITPEDGPMLVSECMSSKVWTIRPSETLRAACNRMLDHDVGALPVMDGARVIGMLTDRDVAVRAVARDLNPDAFVQDVMTPEVVCCFGDEAVARAVELMREAKVRRLPVVDRDRRLIGLLSTSDLAQHAGAETCAFAMSGVAAPGGRHSQTHAP